MIGLPEECSGCPRGQKQSDKQCSKEELSFIDEY